MRKINKKGAEMAIGTLVVIVLAILVLVLIAFGFGTGWANLWGKMKEFFGGSVNVDSVKAACLVACQTNQMQDYCCAKRDITYLDASGAKKTEAKTTCNAQKEGLLKPLDCTVDCTGICTIAPVSASQKIAIDACTTAVTAANALADAAAKAAAITDACAVSKSYTGADGVLYLKTCQELGTTGC